MNIFKKKEKETPEQINEKLIAKYEKLGYPKDKIRLALSRCSPPIKEASLIDALKVVSQETRMASNQSQIDQANQKFISNFYKKYGDLGYDREAIKIALMRSTNIYNENSVIETLNKVVQERTTQAQTQLDQKFINNAFIKYGELGYDQETINKALTRCPNVYNENIMIDTLNLINREKNYPRVGLFFFKKKKKWLILNFFKFFWKEFNK